MFGGFDGHKALSDLYFYKPSDGTWAEVLQGPENPQWAAPQAVGDVWPAPLSCHSASFLGEEVHSCNKVNVWKRGEGRRRIWGGVEQGMKERIVGAF